jgi:Ca2+/Na+ antiporter
MLNTPGKNNTVTLQKSWQERYVIGLLSLIGIVYLILWLVSIFSDTASFVNIEEDKMSMSVSELLNHIRTLLTIALSLGGAVLLIRGSRLGIATGTSVLSLFVVIVSGGLYQALKLGEFSLVIYAAIAFVILLLGLIFLWIPTTSRRLAVNRNTRVLAVGMSIFFGLFYFFVQ